MLFTALAFAVGLYFAWFVWPMPPKWAVSLKMMITGWLNK